MPYYVYIVSNRSRTLYTGVTNNLVRRVLEHREGLIPGTLSGTRMCDGPLRERSKSKDGAAIRAVVEFQIGNPVRLALKAAAPISPHPLDSPAAAGGTSSNFEERLSHALSMLVQI